MFGYRRNGQLLTAREALLNKGTHLEGMFIAFGCMTLFFLISWWRQQLPEMPVIAGIGIVAVVWWSYMLGIATGAAVFNYAMRWAWFRRIAPQGEHETRTDEAGNRHVDHADS